ncbi:kinase-like domain-containing protein [Tribonema minus]|uniref:Kinase-like domain-containing protein n=1 Tax=Tribonema minus TaxID=303371 RepID=A0A836C971_9STRA|nr:kinase-like domain-containing protein [Tribonema minus]
MSKNVGEYLLTTRLGKGSFATVSLGQNRASGSLVAIKIISREQLNRKHTENLESEISILRNFRHPNMVELYDIKKTDNNIYLILEYCEGGDLQRFIKARGRLREGTAQAFMTHLAAGLKFLWERSLIHRDLKPQNLLLAKLPESLAHTAPATGGLILKIADFGFARHLEVASMAETLCGSPLYMAPEILEGRRYDAKADLWSVGAILFEMVVGHPPFGGANHLELLRNIKSRSLVVPEDVEIGVGCLEVLKMLLKRDPNKRASFETFFGAEFVNAGAGLPQYTITFNTDPPPRVSNAQLQP